MLHPAARHLHVSTLYLEGNWCRVFGPALQRSQWASARQVAPGQAHALPEHPCASEPAAAAARAAVQAFVTFFKVRTHIPMSQHTHRKRMFPFKSSRGREKSLALQGGDNILSLQASAAVAVAASRVMNELHAGSPAPAPLRWGCPGERRLLRPRRALGVAGRELPAQEAAALHGADVFIGCLHRWLRRGLISRPHPAPVNKGVEKFA